MFRKYQLKNFNLILVAAVFAQTILGIMVIGSANSDYQNRQIFGMVFGLIIMLVVSVIDYEFVLQFYYVYYVATFLLLLSVLFFGTDVGGATRWVDIGVTRFQPSELGKVLLVLFFAKYFMKIEESVNEPRFIALTAALAAVPLFLIVKEPDLSTTIVTFLIIAAMFFAAGLSSKIVAWSLGIGIPAIGILLILIMQE